jgi:hypothetical protein
MDDEFLGYQLQLIQQSFIREEQYSTGCSTKTKFVLTVFIQQLETATTLELTPAITLRWRTYQVEPGITQLLRVPPGVQGLVPTRLPHLLRDAGHDQLSARACHRRGCDVGDARILDALLPVERQPGLGTRVGHVLSDALDDAGAEAAKLLHGRQRRMFTCWWQLRFNELKEMGVVKTYHVM